MLALVLSTLLLLTSWYGPGFHGNTTANGESYDQYAYTAAHRTLPFDTYLLVEYGENSIVVRINDRGPYCFEALSRGTLAPHPSRDLDLSKASFEALAPVSKGLLEVQTWILPEHLEVRGGEVIPPPLHVPPPKERGSEDEDTWY